MHGREQLLMLVLLVGMLVTSVVLVAVKLAPVFEQVRGLLG